jgi:hypothetical protein
VLPAAFVNMNAAARFAELPERQTGVVVPYAPEQEARVIVELDGAAFTQVPPPQDIRKAHGRFVRTIESGGVGERTLTLAVRSTLRTGVVTPSDYGALAELARLVDAAEEDVIAVRGEVDRVAARGLRIRDASSVTARAPRRPGRARP